jgi:hypothetical protein
MGAHAHIRLDPELGRTADSLVASARKVSIGLVGIATPASVDAAYLHLDRLVHDALNLRLRLAEVRGYGDVPPPGPEAA